jgi:IS30 family transposase
VLVTLAERKSRLSLIALAPDISAQSVKKAMLRLLAKLAERVQTMTYDNGKEFAYHLEVPNVEMRRDTLLIRITPGNMV